MSWLEDAYINWELSGLWQAPQPICLFQNGGLIVAFNPAIPNALHAKDPAWGLLHGVLQKPVTAV